MGFEELISAWRSSRVGMEAVVDAMVSTIALARGSSSGLKVWELGRCLEGEEEGMTFWVKAWIAALVFLVPKVKLRVERAERV